MVIIMKWKRYATLLLMAVLAFAVCKNTVSAAAKTSSVATKSSVTLKKSSDTQTSATYTASDLRLMASIINCEAGAESYQGKLAVGIVVMNRVSSDLFPNTIRKVIYQKGQFSPVRNGSLKKRLAQYDAGKTSTQQWKDCISAAKKVLTGQDYIIYKGAKKSMKTYHFFSVYLSGARFRLGGHRFK
jgi:spore germination cell wall hydrolase CwlJ-like protein